MIEANSFTSIDIGNILTAGSVLVAAGGLIYTWRNDQRLRRHEAANRIRSAAAATIAGLDLWVDFAQSLFENLQEVFVKVSEELLVNKDVSGTRDRLWAEMNRVHSEIASAQRQERLQSTYADLYGYGRDSYEQFNRTLIGLKEKEAEVFDSLLDATQNDVVRCQRPLSDYPPAELKKDQPIELRKNYQPADLGNSLRGTAAKGDTEMKRELEGVLGPFRNYLEGLVRAGDEELVRNRNDTSGTGLRRRWHRA
jgi:hypothetical protein